MITTTGISTNMPRNRSVGIRHSTISQAATATNPITIENSYMLPHGTRCTANPRSRIEVRWTSAPSRVMPTAISPARSDLVRRSGRRASVGPADGSVARPGLTSVVRPVGPASADLVGVGAVGAVSPVDPEPKPALTSGPPAPTSTRVGSAGTRTVTGASAVSATRPLPPNAYSAQ